MRRSILPPVLRTFAVFACVLPLAGVQAQTPPPPAEAAAQSRAEGRQNQKVENIHTEDSGASVDEVRFGGQTQSITVTPKGGMPSYEVLPNTGARAAQGVPAQSDSGGNGPRVWNVFKF